MSFILPVHHDQIEPYEILARFSSSYESQVNPEYFSSIAQTFIGMWSLSWGCAM